MSVFLSVLVSSIVKTTEPTLIKFAPNSYFWVIVLARVIIRKFENQPLFKKNKPKTNL